MSVVAAELIARVTADVSQAERELKGFSQRMGSMTGGVFSGNLLSSGVSALGRGLADIGRIGVGAFGDIMSTGMDFAAQMDAVSAVLGGTAAEASALSDLAINLAIDPQLKVDATEAAAAIQNLATAGLTAEQILGGATEATVLLANATGGDFGQAATVATDVMSLFNIEAGDMMSAVDGIAAVSNVSKFDLNDYALAISQAGGVAALSGISFEDFNATIAATAPYFASGSDAGTSFKTFLQRLNPTTKEAKDLMFELGLLTDAGTSTFYDATGALKDMDAIAEIMNETFGDMTESQKSFYLGQLFGTDAMRTAGAITDMTWDSYNNLKDAMADTSAIDMAATATDNLKARWENFNGAIEATKLKIFTALEPALIGIMDNIMPALDAMTPMITTWAENFGKTLSDGLANVRATANVVWDISEGDLMTTIMASIGRITGATLTLDAEAKVTDVDWGWFKYTYDALGEVRHWDFYDLGYTYDAKGEVTTWTFREDGSFTYEAEGEVSTWTFGNLDYTYNADGTIDTLSWGGQTITSEGDAISIRLEAFVDVAANPNAMGLKDRAWLLDLQKQLVGEAFQFTLEVGEVVWGVWTHTYDVVGKVALMLWGTWTNIYDVTSNVIEVLWGNWTNKYPVLAEVGEVLWGAWTHTYDAFASIGDWINNIGTVRIPATAVIQGEPIVTETRPRAPADSIGANRNSHNGGYEGPYGSYATGTAMFGGGWAWVGERGPELVRLPRASRIYNDQDSAAMAGGGTTIVQYNTVKAPHEIELLASRVAAHMARKGR